MLTTTALVLATLIPTVQSVSPTVTPTYTTREMQIYERGWKNSVRNYSCLILCDQIKTHRKTIKNLKKLKLQYKDSAISSWAIKVIDKDIKNYIEKVEAEKKEIKERGDCDCSKFEDKK